MAHNETEHWTSFEDVIARWVGPGAPTDEDLVDALILDAEAIIRAEYPLIQTRIDDDELPLDLVKMVVARMVSRVLRNPDSVSYWQQQTGPFGQARNFGENTDIWLSENEKTMLAPSKRGKAYQVNQGHTVSSASLDDLIWTRAPLP
jgi:pantoate kinase